MIQQTVQKTFDDFDDFRRKGGQAILENIAMLDKNMRFPSEILAFKLRKRGDITKEERLVVLTGMDYEKNRQERQVERSPPYMKKPRNPSRNSKAMTICRGVRNLA